MNKKTWFPHCGLRFVITLAVFFVGLQCKGEIIDIRTLTVCDEYRWLPKSKETDETRLYCISRLRYLEPGLQPPKINEFDDPYNIDMESAPWRFPDFSRATCAILIDETLRDFVDAESYIALSGNDCGIAEFNFLKFNFGKLNPVAIRLIEPSPSSWIGYVLALAGVVFLFLIVVFSKSLFGRIETHDRRAVELPPLHYVSGILRFVYPPKTYARVFETALSDIHQEYVDALRMENDLLARWVVIRGYFVLTKTVSLHFASSTIGKLIRQIVQ